MIVRTSTAAAALLIALLATSTSMTAATATSTTTTTHYAITSQSYQLKDHAPLQNACASEFGPGASTLDLDADWPQKQWQSAVALLPSLARFTHYWALADSDYLDRLSDSRGVILEYLWGQQVEPVLMGDREMPSFLKVQVLCKIVGEEQPPQKKEPLLLSASAYGHFHISTWGGDTQMDFGKLRGSCQFTLLEIPHFSSTLGPLTLQVRTKQAPMWSYMDAAVLQIGDSRLQVAGGGADANHYWVDGQYQAPLDGLSFPVHYRPVNARQREFEIPLSGTGTTGNTNTVLQIKTFHQYVRVNVQTGEKEPAFLQGAVGLLGSFPTGEWMARDQTTQMKTVRKFAKEWTHHSSSSSVSLFVPHNNDDDNDNADNQRCSFDIVASSRHEPEPTGDNESTDEEEDSDRSIPLSNLRHLRRRLTASGDHHHPLMTEADAQKACERVHRTATPQQVTACVQQLLEVAQARHQRPPQWKDQGAFAEVYHALFDHTNDLQQKKQPQPKLRQEEEEEPDSNKD